jgi:PTS system glucitol/sorbitol-specific IIA component
MKYSTTITGWGVEALDFLDEGFVVIFDTNAPEELAEIAILHEHAEVTADPAPGDSVSFCGKTYTITAVGDEALHTLRTLGHCTLVFSGAAEAELPGQIVLKGERPTAADIQVGGKIEIA